VEALISGVIISILGVEIVKKHIEVVFNITDNNNMAKTLIELESLLDTAVANYKACGCRVYKEEIHDIKTQIKALQGA
jgi:uncharacterized membrane protein YqhA